MVIPVGTVMILIRELCLIPFDSCSTSLYPLLKALVTRQPSLSASPLFTVDRRLTIFSQQFYYSCFNPVILRVLLVMFK
jgi:hypothetical protein